MPCRHGWMNGLFGEALSHCQQYSCRPAEGLASVHVMVWYENKSSLDHGGESCNGLYTATSFTHAASHRITSQHNTSQAATLPGLYEVLVKCNQVRDGEGRGSLMLMSALVKC
jgi:hypothetical protein